MKFIKWILSRIVITGLLILFQLFLFFYFLFGSYKYGALTYALIDALAVCITLYLINKSYEPTMKMSWLLLIVAFPVVGVPTYLLFSSNHIFKKYKKIYISEYPNDKENEEYLKTILRLEGEDEEAASQFKYIYNTSKMPVKGGTRSEYLPTGELFFDKLLQELKKADKYIFMEYFIIEEGKMWNTILNILKKKVGQGVDVRIVYDDLGCISTLPYGYDKKLRKMGIKCYKFNRFVPVVSAIHNNRDHRKITIIDGKVGFVSGANLADEYINEKVKYGRWKDTGIFLEGKAVDNLLAIFMPTYNAIAKCNDKVEDYKFSEYIDVPSYTQVYATGPTSVYDENIASGVYLNFINSAKKYLYITTPYLVSDYNIMNALELASKRGVDVRIIAPGIPDKKVVNMMTKQSYEPLLKAGVKIYEYTPGFIHSKQMVSDDKRAILGTINLDYRSLVHNFECAVYLHNDETVKEMRDEYIDLLEDCDEIDLKSCKVKWYVSLLRKTVSFFAPLL